jgi:hypothetical protein
MSTREMVVEPDSSEPDPEKATNFVGVSRQRFEFLGGCLKVDDDQVGQPKLEINISYLFVNLQNK